MSTQAIIAISLAVIGALATAAVKVIKALKAKRQ